MSNLEPWNRHKLGDQVQRTDLQRVGTIVYVDRADPGLPWAVSYEIVLDPTEKNLEAAYDSGEWEWLSSDEIRPYLHIIEEVPV